MVKIKKKTAKKISYGGKRNLSEIKYIVIHYTGNKGDTAKNNADYFATGNTRQAGAHFFVDKKGIIYKSVNMSRIAWAVGGLYTLSNGAGAYYGKCTNSNSISIELCDCCIKTNWEQMLATRQLIQHIQKKCPNARTVIRHWDVNGKNCPASMTGTDNERWVLFHIFVTKGYQFKGVVTKKTAVRSSPKATLKNKTGAISAGRIVKITKMNGNWGRLKDKNADGGYQWVSLSKLKEV